jgi:uncharacterized OB-fold protein
MTDTKFVCSVCKNVFSDHRCPNCGSYHIEPDHFDPDEPVENPFEETEEGYTA